jgi:hypothetical protein
VVWPKAVEQEQASEQYLPKIHLLGQALEEMMEMQGRIWKRASQALRGDKDQIAKELTRILMILSFLI